MAAIPFKVQEVNAYVDALAPTLDVPYTKGMARGFVVSVAGNVAVTTAAGSAVILPANAGVLYNICTSMVSTTGTTATGIFVLF